MNGKAKQGMPTTELSHNTQAVIHSLTSGTNPKERCGARLLLAFMIGLIFCWNAPQPADAADAVQFEGARYSLTASQAIANNVPIFPPAPKLLLGYVQKPDGPGPFPAVIVLHGCAGLGSLFNPDRAHNLWPDLLTSWGYAVLIVDSFTTRGVKDTCDTDTRYYRMQDAFGGLAFLRRQPYVDTERVALLGFSAGGAATLEALKTREPQILDIARGLDFKVGVAFYPCFGSSLDSAKPILILNGEADDWSKQSVCRAMMNLRPASAVAVRLVSFPNAAHAFDFPAMQPGRIGFGHWLEYNADAAKKATEEVRSFLSENLKK
jgi:dienelactone hydrolase